MKIFHFLFLIIKSMVLKIAVHFQVEILGIEIFGVDIFRIEIFGVEILLDEIVA